MCVVQSTTIVLIVVYWLIFNLSVLYFVDSPNVIIPAAVVKAPPGHMLWCAAKGTPPIEVTLLRKSKVLFSGRSLALIKKAKEGNYTCTARNKGGADTRHFPVTITSTLLKNCT